MGERTIEYCVDQYKEGRTIASSASSSSLINFVMKLPFLLHMGDIPPLHIMNETFQLGSQSDGMGENYKWTPFSIGEDEYQELTPQIIARGPYYYKVSAPPDWVKTTGWVK